MRRLYPLYDDVCVAFLGLKHQNEHSTPSLLVQWRYSIADFKPKLDSLETGPGRHPHRSFMQIDQIYPRVLTLLYFSPSLRRVSVTFSPIGPMSPIKWTI